MDSVGSIVRNLYTLRNGDAMRLRARLRAVRSELARRVWGETLECILTPDTCSPRQGWVLFDDGTERSVGIHFESLEPHVTPLSRYTAIVRTARRLKIAIADLPGIVDSSVLPDGWNSDRFLVQGQPVWVAGPVAGSGEVEGIALEDIAVEDTTATSSLERIAVEVMVPLRPEVGTEIHLTRCGVALSSGVLQPCILTATALGTICLEIREESEDMEQKKENVRSRASIPVRVDLGTIEVPSSVLESIVPGMVLELVTQEPFACFLQIGNRALAKGKLQITDEGVTVTVTKVFER